MARVVNLECDKCGLTIRNDLDRISLWWKRVKFDKYEIYTAMGDDDVIYLCGKCAKEFRRWLKDG